MRTVPNDGPSLRGVVHLRVLAEELCGKMRSVLFKVKLDSRVVFRPVVECYWIDEHALQDFCNAMAGIRMPV